MKDQMCQNLLAKFGARNIILYTVSQPRLRNVIDRLQSNTLPSNKLTLSDKNNQKGMKIISTNSVILVVLVSGLYII